MKESCNWHPPIKEESRSRAQTKRFSIPYPESMPGRSPPATPAANNKRQFTLLDKENYRGFEKPERKKTISPYKKKPAKRKPRRTQQNIIGYLNKTEYLRQVLPIQPLKVLTCGSYADFIRGKSAESKRQRRIDWYDREYREMSLSLKKRSLSKELKKIFKQDNRYRQRGKRPSTELNRSQPAPKSETIPLMRDILRYIKRESENAKRKDKDKEKYKEKDNTLNESKKLKKERKKSLYTTITKKIPTTGGKTVNTAPSQPRLRKRRVSTVVEYLPEPESDSLRFRQSTEYAYMPTSKTNQYIEVVHLTEADEFDLNYFREFYHRYLQKDRKSKRHPVLLTTELKTEMAVKIQRWWRRILTRRLVNQFIRYTRQHSERSSSEMFIRTDSEGGAAASIEEVISQHFNEQGNEPHAGSYLSNIDLNFHYDGNMRKITYISNLSGEEDGVSHNGELMRLRYNEAPSSHQFVQDDLMNRIKQKELDRLNEFITLIKESLSGGGRTQTEELLKKLVERSYLNCKSLEKEPYIMPSVELTEPQPTEHLEGEKEKSPSDEHYEEVDDDYRSRGNRSSSDEAIPHQSSAEEMLTGHIENRLGYGIQKRPTTPSLEHQYSRIEEELIGYREPDEAEEERLVLKDEDEYARAVPLSLSTRERLLYDRTHSPSGRSSSESSSHELMPYIQDEIEEDPLVGLQAAYRLRRKLEELNTRTFEAENYADLFGNDSEDEEAPPLKRYLKGQLHRNYEYEPGSYSESSSEWEAFPRLERLLQILPDKYRLSDDAAHIILTHLTTEFLKDISQTSAARTFKMYALKMREKEKRVITVKKAVFRKSKGIKTNIAAVKEYLKGFNMYLIERRSELLKKLDEPTAPSARELLRYMHPYEYSSESCYDSSVLVLPVELFHYYWLIYERQLGQINPNASYIERSYTDYTHRISQIHCRAIFDGFNECLNFYRNYGYFGKPFPWKRVPNFYKKGGIEQYKLALENAYQRTIQIASSYCGIIFDKQESPSGMLPTKQHMEQMHEDRLSRALVLEMYEAERNWLFYDDEETEVIVELAHNVYEFLIREMLEQVQRMFRLRSLL